MSEVYVDVTAIIDKGVILGTGTKIWHFVHIMREVKIGRDCVIGDYVSVGRSVKIGDKVKIEDRATIFEGVTIEDSVFVGPLVTFTNDLYPRSLNKDWKITPTLVKQGSSIGAGTVIVCGVTIGEYAMIGAGSVVTNNISSYALAFGNPAKIRGFVCRCGRKLELKNETELCVYMACPVCKEKYEISAEDYARIETGE